MKRQSWIAIFMVLSPFLLAEALADPAHPATVVVSCPSNVTTLIVHDRVTSTVWISRDQLQEVAVSDDWLEAMLDGERNMIYIRFVGEQRTTASAQMTIVGKECRYPLQVYVTDIEAAADQFLHLDQVEPESLDRVQVKSAQLRTGVDDMGVSLEAEILSGRADITTNREHGDGDDLSAHLQLTGGLLWASNSLTGDRLEPASMAGVGIAIRKGITPLIILDTEALLAWSGEAHFRDVHWDGRVGELSQETTLARADLGLRLRFGEFVIPTVRLSLGIEGCRSRFAFGDGTLSQFGPEDEFSYAFIASLTAGFDVDVGDHVLAGASVTASGRRSATAAIHTGYRR